jgi:hypothetical protein
MGIHTHSAVAEWVEILTRGRDSCIGRGTGMPLRAEAGVCTARVGRISTVRVGDRSAVRQFRPNAPRYYVCREASSVGRGRNPLSIA